jgi:hypothetical protein
MVNRTHESTSALAHNQDEIPTVRPPQSGWQHRRSAPSLKELSLPPNDGLWQLVCDVMRAEADEALWGMRR